MSLTLEQAQAAINAAKNKAQELDLKMNIALVDAGANLTAFSRMDGDLLGSIDFAVKNAYTARFFDMPTGGIGKIIVTIGVSGSTVENDHTVAEGGMNAVK